MKIYNCGIYQIINIINGKCYVGQSTQLKRRKRDHFRDFRNNVHDNSYLQKSWNKYGESVFSFNILIYCEKYELTRYEQYFSDYYKKNNLSYNIRECVDSNFGVHHTEDAKKKMSLDRKGKRTGKDNPMYKKHHSEETKRAIAFVHLGKKLSDKHKQKISISLTGENNPNYGNQRSDETKKKMSLNHSDVKKEKNPWWNKHPSLETIRKMSDSRINLWKNKKGEIDKKMMQLKFSEYRKSDESFKPEFYDEDYFENGRETKKSCLESYHWMPIRSFREALAFVECLNLNENSHVLDFGGGKGFIVKALRILGIRSDVADISRYALKFAPKGSWNSSIKRNWDNHCDNYTHIIAKDVFEHLTINQLNSILIKLSNLAPKMMCIVPMGENGKYRIPEYELDKSHILRENEDWWYNAFENNGWKVVQHMPHLKGIKDNWIHYPEGNHVFVLKGD